jgi:hypothetical protein
VLTTKPAFLSVLAADTDAAILDRVAMIGGYGLPNVDDVKRLVRLPESTGLWFLGDLDPVDLMIYAWLRTKLPFRKVAYLGVGDALLSALNAGIAEFSSIVLSPSEKLSLPTLYQAFPNVRETVGSQCFELLSGGYKIELEAVADKVRSTNSILQMLVAGERTLDMP